MDFFLELGKNRIFIVTATTWIIAQFIKVLIGVLVERKFDFRWLVGTGGMPSSHCAGAAAFATSLGLGCGFDSPFFAIGVVFAIVTMFDAQGARRAIGKQAESLNMMFEDIYFKKPIKEDRLIELIGHTPVQVLTGAALGIVLGYFLYIYI
ncbi:MAG: divergent PAP2 family protein [Candidatus Omnitrophica bacterium]|nr:divergent PAP2 family protein [Candidatus Omnitrophota bacterium]